MQEQPLNITTPSAAHHAHAQSYDALENGGHHGTPRTALARRSTGADSLDDAASSSPFVTSVDESASTASSSQENNSPSKDKRRSRIMSGSEISPLKMLARSNSSESGGHAAQGSLDEKLAPPAPNSPRKSISPMRRFPVRINTGDGGGAASSRGGRPQSIPPPVREREEPDQADVPELSRRQSHSYSNSTSTSTTYEREMSLDEAIAQNPGVRHAIEIFEDTLDSIGDDDEEDDTDIPGEGVTVKAPPGDGQEPQPNHADVINDESVSDETMLSEFSTFSAIPSMTTFARLGGRTPTQMAQDARTSSNATTNLLDFTDNLRFPGGRTSPTRGLTVADAKKTPQRQSIANLLDFEIPPMPTPRSVPSISARELESLKSNFMSEISSLKATLSGKEAEAASLKTALMDAEKRAGESGEALREERTLREQFSEDKETWEKRGREMETVLRQVKDEIMTTQREREALEARLEESEGRREAAEMMAQEAESKMAAMRASKAGDNVNSPGGVKSPTARASQREIELAVEKVARELHAAYKSKHEAKVAALKKNYENRWDKKIREMEAKIEELTRENEELRVGRDATLTKVELEAGERRDQAVKDSAQIKELRAEVEKLEAVLKTVQGDNDSLRSQLECERVEKGEMVVLAEELMQMQSNQSVLAAQNGHSERESTPIPTPVEHTTPPKRVPQRASAPVPPRGQPMGLTRSATTTTPRKTAAAPSPSGIPGGTVKSGVRNSMIGRPGSMMSGLKAPSSSRIGGPPPSAHARAQSNVAAASGIGRPASGLARPGNLMSSIQQMGSYRGRGE